MSIAVMKATLATLESMSQAMFDKGIALTDSEEYGIENFRAAIAEMEKQEPVAAGPEDQTIYDSIAANYNKQPTIPDVNLLQKAYLLGFNASCEGYNGEYPFVDNFRKPDADADWIGYRDAEIETLLAAAPQLEDKP